MNKKCYKHRTQVSWSNIVGMLTNLGGLSLGRIHRMLRMFALASGGSDSDSGGAGSGGAAGGDSSGWSRVHHLRQFLEAKVRDGLLEFEDNLYKLPS